LTTDKIKQFIKEAHDNAVEKGFYDCPECNEDGIFVDGVLESGFDIECPTCYNTGIDPNKNIGELLMLIVSELGEALEAHRKNEIECDIDDIIENITSFNPILFRAGIKQMEIYKNYFPFEIADVFIRLFDLCGYLRIEPEIESEYSELSIFDNIGEHLLKITEFICFCFYKGGNGEIDREESISISFSSLLDLCNRLDIPIERHITAKMAYNRTRPYKHRKEY